MSAYDEIRRRLTRREAAFEPCLPRPAKEPPVGPEWIHEIKHDGFRILVRRQGRRVRLVSRKSEADRRRLGCPYLDGLVVGLFVPLPGVAELPVPGIPPAAPVPLAAPPAPVPAPPAPPAWAHEPETVPKRSAKPSATTSNFCILSTPMKISHWLNQWHKHSFLL